MINVNDLMRGNFIKTREGITEVSKIHRDSVGDKWGAIYFDDEIVGIEVVEEMFEKMGFKKEDSFKEYGFYRYWDKEHRYKLEVDSVFCNSYRKWSLHVDNDVCNTIGCGEFTYLHELMNLVRVITGYELKIEKEVFYGLDD
jgi:hypothetical protein